MKKLLLSALLIGSTSFAASADVFQFDPDQDGTFLNVDTLSTQIFPLIDTNVRQYLGADLALNDGDAFEEEFVYNSSKATLDPLAGHTWPDGDLNFSFDLEGTIENVTSSADLINSPGTFDADMSASTFDTVFTNSAAALTIDYMGTVIGVFDLVRTISSPPIALDGSSVNSAFVLAFGFNDAWVAGNQSTVDAVYRKENGALVDTNLFEFIIKGSAGPNGTSDGLFDTDLNTPFDPFNISSNENVFVDINVTDNGSTISARIPEPSTIAILSLGLLGLARIRRKA